MAAIASSRRSPLQALQWRKDFSIRQTIIYHGQDNRLRVHTGESVIDVFFRCFKPDLSPPRHHELLRLFLEQTGALRSFLDVIGSRRSAADRQVLAMIDDRCDPCLKIMRIPESAAFFPVRQWGSEEYMQRPPRGLNVHICGMDAEMLYAHLNRDVGSVSFKRVVSFY